MYREIIKRNNDKKGLTYYSKKDDKWKNVILPQINLLSILLF